MADKLRQDVRARVEARVGLGLPPCPNGVDARRVVQEWGRAEFNQHVTPLLLTEARQAGLPVRTGPDCKAALATARVMQEISTALRTQRFVTVPGEHMDGAKAAAFRRWLQDHPPEGRPGARRVLVQMLQAENEGERLVLVAELARAPDDRSTVALARRAIFDLSATVRRAAVRALRQRGPDGCREVLLAGLRYPWPPVAAHAAEALVALKDRGAVPRLAELAGAPDPSLPAFDPVTQKHMVRELVRVNHFRNCYLCHPAAPVLAAPVGGLVPQVGKALPRLYYDSMNGEFVRADITFLRQDFSVCQPVADPGPWPARQRFDFVVRQREATAEEAVALQKPAPPGYPQRDAVLFALSRLRAAGDGSLAPAPRPPAPVPASERGHAGVPALLADLASLGVGPRAAAHLRATSPDGTAWASAVNGEVVVTGPGMPGGGFRLGGHSCPVTSVWWSLDGKTIVTDDVQGMVVTHDAGTGAQRLAFFKQ